MVKARITALLEAEHPAAQGGMGRKGKCAAAAFAGA
jgi:hypothetical protein